jgi:hypothetical protein
LPATRNLAGAETSTPGVRTLSDSSLKLRKIFLCLNAGERNHAPDWDALFVFNPLRVTWLNSKCLAENFEILSDLIATILARRVRINVQMLLDSSMQLSADTILVETNWHASFFE